ncbi:chemokine-like protein TAFA-5 isoform 2-T2 [Hipposideros larvatus]
MQLLKALWALAGAALCCFLVLAMRAQFLREGQLAAGTCEIVTLDRDSSQPRRTIARQTARCACRKGQIAGTTRARPACVDGLRDSQDPRTTCRLGAVPATDTSRPRPTGWVKPAASTSHQRTARCLHAPPWR